MSEPGICWISEPSAPRLGGTCARGGNMRAAATTKSLCNLGQAPAPLGLI